MWKYLKSKKDVKTKSLFFIKKNISVNIKTFSFSAYEYYKQNIIKRVIDNKIK